MFGVPLEVATKQTKLPDGVELPRVFREGIVHIDENCKYFSSIINNYYCERNVMLCLKPGE